MVLKDENVVDGIDQWFINCVNHSKLIVVNQSLIIEGHYDVISDVVC